MQDIKQHEERLDDHIQDDREFHALVLKRLDDLEKRLEPITDVYRAILFNKSFIVGLGSIVSGIVLIGSAILWLLQQR